MSIKERETMVCQQCGDSQTLFFFDNINERLKKNGTCHSCDFWNEKVGWRNKNDQRAVVVDGIHYHIGKEDSTPRNWRGFGGAPHRIQFHDGRVVSTTNLWCQGHIPASFRDVLTDNAVFTPATPAEEASK